MRELLGRLGWFAANRNARLVHDTRCEEAAEVVALLLRYGRILIERRSALALFAVCHEVERLAELLGCPLNDEELPALRQALASRCGLEY